MVFAVYSELMVTAQELTHASMVSNIIWVDVERQKPVLLTVKRCRFLHHPKIMVETSLRKRWSEASMYRLQHVQVNKQTVSVQALTLEESLARLCRF